MPAANIDDAIAMCADEIAVVSYGAVESLDTQMGLWNSGMFNISTGIFQPGIGQRSQQGTVSDWFGPHLLARDQILGTGVGDSTPVGTSAVIDVVFRVLNAVKFANINGFITQGQEDDTVALFNAVWD